MTKKSFDKRPVPSVADLRARQIEMTVAAVREALSSDDLDDYNSVLHGLAGDDSDRNIALAAIKLVHEARSSAADETEIPDASKRMKDRGAKFDKRGDKGARPNKPHRKGGERSSGDTGFIYVGLGRQGGMRPGDLVGAIANETDLVGREIGPIRISDKFAVVGVPDAAVDRVIGALKATTVKGKKPRIRRYVD